MDGGGNSLFMQPGADVIRMRWQAAGTRGSVTHRQKRAFAC
jgi:hypothetical protein